MGYIAIAFYKTEDVRPILKAYQGKDIAVEYAKREAELKAKFLADWKVKGGGRGATSTLSFSSLFGGKDPLVRIFPSPPIRLSLPPLLPLHSDLIYLLPHSYLAEYPNTTANYGPQSSPAQNVSEPLTYLEQERRKAQHQYRLEQKYIQENQAELDRTLQEDRDRQMKEMGSASLLGWVSGMAGLPPPERKEEGKEEKKAMT